MSDSSSFETEYYVWSIHSAHTARARAHTHTSTSLICSPLSPRFRREWSGELRKSESEIDKEKVKSCLIMSSSVAQKQYSKTQARWSVVYCPSSLKISKLTTAKQKHKREHLCVFYRFAGIAHPKMCKQYLQFCFLFIFFTIPYCCKTQILNECATCFNKTTTMADKNYHKSTSHQGFTFKYILWNILHSLSLFFFLWTKCIHLHAQSWNKMHKNILYTKCTCVDKIHISFQTGAFCSQNVFFVKCKMHNAGAFCYSQN